MENKDFFDKILKSMSTVIKKPIILSNVKNVSKIICTVGVFCVTNLIVQFVGNFKLNKVIENQNTVTEKQDENQRTVLNELKFITTNKEKTNEILLSLLKLNDNLFSDLRLIIKNIKNIHQEIGEINKKINFFEKVEIHSESDGEIITIDTKLADSVIEEFLTPTSVGSYDVKIF
jgi:hypothetical protein